MRYEPERSLTHDLFDLVLQQHRFAACMIQAQKARAVQWDDTITHTVSSGSVYLSSACRDDYLASFRLAEVEAASR